MSFNWCKIPVYINMNTTNYANILLLYSFIALECLQILYNFMNLIMIKIDNQVTAALYWSITLRSKLSNNWCIWIEASGFEFHSRNIQLWHFVIISELYPRYFWWHSIQSALPHFCTNCMYFYTCHKQFNRPIIIINAKA